MENLKLRQSQGILQGGRKYEISWEPNFPVNDIDSKNRNKSDIKSRQINVIFHHKITTKVCSFVLNS